MRIRAEERQLQKTRTRVFCVIFTFCCQVFSLSIRIREKKNNERRKQSALIFGQLYNAKFIERDITEISKRNSNAKHNHQLY